MYKIVTTRFDSVTLKENETFKKKHNIVGCIYGQPRLMPKAIKLYEKIFVIEMNNTLNMVEGVGLIKNITYHDMRYNIYKSENHNQYIYKSRYHIGRKELVQYNDELVIILDKLLFKGRGHLKRGYGFTTITHKLLKNIEKFDLFKELQLLFINIYVNNEKINNEKINNEK